MVYVRVLAVVALLGSIGWVVADPGFESVLAVVGATSALASVFLIERRNARRAQQHQSVSEFSIGVQAGGDISIGSAHQDKDAK